ncbi:MAG: hypothetical protein HKM98_03140 [Gammaproteobacteria bacterium]|nr:hypothetical protein [Gammaproteobacteria bacterium]
MKKSNAKLPTIESVVRFFDELEDAFISTMIGLRRRLSRKPRERRRELRTPDQAAKRNSEPDENR